MRCKYFDIGMGRTATRSIYEAAIALGMEAQHGHKGARTYCANTLERVLQGRLDLDIYEKCDYNAGIANVH